MTVLLTIVIALETYSSVVIVFVIIAVVIFKVVLSFRRNKSFLAGILSHQSTFN